MRVPDHLRKDRGRLRRLRRQANGLRGLYGAPVYLCGSALLDFNVNPRDWDLRIVLPDDLFALRYGGGLDAVKAVGAWNHEGLTGKWSEVRWRWSDDCVKQSQKASRETGLNIDFQVYPKTHADALYKHRPRLRLDTRVRA